MKNDLPVALIPARGGSKRIPGKNIRSFNGRPIIEYAIVTAQNSGIFSEVYVSTDDPKIAKIAIRAGANVPFERPESLSTDDIRADLVVGHFSQWLNAKGFDPDICCILPTTPGLVSSDLISSFQEWQTARSKVVTLFAVTEFQTTAFRSFIINENQELIALFPDQLQKQTQDLPPTYSDAGQFYWATSESWRRTTSITAEKSQGFVLPIERAIDINTELDWQLATKLLR